MREEKGNITISPDENTIFWKMPNAEFDNITFSAQTHYRSASRIKRLIASMIDVLVHVILYLIIIKIFSNFQGIEVFSLKRLLLIIISNLLFLIVNYIFLIKGQTIGKRIMKIRVVTLHNTVPTIFNIFIIRYLLFVVVAFLIGLVNFKIIHIELLNYLGLIDFLMIFGKQKRCLHDFIAKTRVINIE